MPLTESRLDWKAGEKHFIEHTGLDVGFREYAMMTPSLAWTGYQEVSYKTLAEHAKNYRWRAKRAKFIYANNPSLYADSQIMYDLLRDRRDREGDTMKVGDLVSLCNAMTSLQEVLRTAMDATNEDHPDFVDRDTVVSLVSQMGSLTEDDLLDQAAEIVAKETPV